MNVISVSRLRKNMKKHLDDVSYSSDTLFVSRATDKEAVVIISLKEYNTLVETGHLLSTSVNSKRLRDSINQLENKNTRKVVL